MHELSRLTCAVCIAVSFVFGNSVAKAQITFHSQTPLSGFVTDVWEYVDPVTDTPYALVGAGSGVQVYDVTDPSDPDFITSINIPSFDIKTWGFFLYGVTGGGGTNQGKIVDMSDPLNPIIVSSFNSAHNIWISDTGFLYAEAPGVKVYDLNPDPTNPELVWDGGNSGGHDAATIGDRLFDFNGGSATNIYQITEGETFSLDLLGTINDPQIAYHHQGWTTEDGQYLFICDELSSHPNADISVWDISDPGDPTRVDEYADATATVHNLYIIGDYAYVAYYSAGFRVFDVGSEPGTITMVDEYDTSPSSGQGFDGAFGVYPFSKTGNIYVSDQSGLYIFSFDPIKTDVDEDGLMPESFSLAQNYPNPFNPSTTIEFTLPSEQFVTITLSDVLGREVSTLVNEKLAPGTHTRRWTPVDLSSGLYLYTMRAGDFVGTKKLMYLR